MYDLIPFRFPETDQEIRTMLIDGEPWVVAADVAAMLGYARPAKAAADHVDDEDRNTVPIQDGTPGNPNVLIINESGLYALIFGSKLPAAKGFKRWVTAEVLPALRKSGSYALSVPRSDLDVLRGAIDAIEATRERTAKLEARADATDAKLSALAGEYDEFSALAYARREGLPTDRTWLSLVGRRASKLMRDAGSHPRTRQDASFGAINIYPAKVLAEAVRQLGA